MVSGRWSVVGGRWSVVSGQRSVVGGRWSVVSGRWSVVGFLDQGEILCAAADGIAGGLDCDRGRAKLLLSRTVRQAAGSHGSVGASPSRSTISRLGRSLALPKCDFAARREPRPPKGPAATGQHSLAALHRTLHSMLSRFLPRANAECHGKSRGRGRGQFPVLGRQWGF